jgi:thioredoxin 2
MIRSCPTCATKNRIPAARLAEVGRCGRCKSTLGASAEPIDITDVQSFDELIAGATVPVLVDFWAPWCGPCRAVAPEVKSAAAQLATHAVVAKVNTEQLPALASRYQVQAIPNFALFRDGAMVRQQPGAMGSRDLVRWVSTG